jgi:hypothetical protein
MGLASQIRRHITVVLLNDGLLARGGGAEKAAISIVSSLPRDKESGPTYAILRSIKTTVFVYVIMSKDGTFYPVIILLKNQPGDSSSWHRFLPQSLILPFPIDQETLLGLYTQCIVK